MRHSLCFFLSSVVLLSGCMTTSGSKPTVEDRNKPASTSDAAIPTPPPLVTPTPLPIDGAKPMVALPQTQATAAPVAVPPAAMSLIRQAQQQEQQGDLAMASASLERALRIAPTSAEVYYRLARIRQAQGQQEQAVQFARRGLSQGADAELQGKLQAIIGVQPNQ